MLACEYIPYSYEYNSTRMSTCVLYAIFWVSSFKWYSMLFSRNSGNSSRTTSQNQWTSSVTTMFSAILFYHNNIMKCHWLDVCMPVWPHWWSASIQTQILPVTMPMIAGVYQLLSGCQSTYFISFITSNSVIALFTRFTQVLPYQMYCLLDPNSKVGSCVYSTC